MNVAIGHCSCSLLLLLGSKAIDLQFLLIQTKNTKDCASQAEVVYPVVK